jgi:hypothetical protein
LWRHLRAVGVHAVYGEAGVPNTTVVPAALAPTLAAAHQRVHRRTAATWSSGVLTVSGDRPAAGPGRRGSGAGPGSAAGSRPAGAPDLAGRDSATPGTGRAEPAVLVVRDVRELEEAVAAGALRPGRALRVDIDLDQPAATRPAAHPKPPQAQDVDVDALAARLAVAANPVVLAGPGVVTAGAVPGLHALATAGRLGVLNTWGAKGVFPWRSVHHWATVGLQRDDFVLGGLPEADLIIATGLDPAESPDERWQLAEHLIVPPESLGQLAQAWRRDQHELRMPRLRDLLAAATQRGWAVDTAPLPPSRVTLAYGEVAGTGGLVAADPGVAGFWVARTVATTVLDSVVVPAERGASAVACAIVARLVEPARPALAVLDGPIDDRSAELHALSAALGVPVPIENWLPDGPRLDAAAHAERLADAVHAEEAVRLPLAVDGDRITDLTDVAGPIVAWEGCR